MPAFLANINQIKKRIQNKGENDISIDQTTIRSGSLWGWGMGMSSENMKVI